MDFGQVNAPAKDGHSESSPLLAEVKATVGSAGSAEEGGEDELHL